MARHQCHRGKPKKRPNRYNPNKPDWNAVHRPSYFADSLLKLLTGKKAQ